MSAGEQGGAGPSTDTSTAAVFSALAEAATPGRPPVVLVDGGSIWVLGDDQECIVVDPAHDLEDRLEELNQERAGLQMAMRRIGETFASNLDREALLEIVVGTAVDGIKADAGRASVRPTFTEPLEQVAISGDVHGLKEAISAAEAQVLETGEWGQPSFHQTHAVT